MGWILTFAFTFYAVLAFLVLFAGAVAGNKEIAKAGFSSLLSLYLFLNLFSLISYGSLTNVIVFLSGYFGVYPVNFFVEVLFGILFAGFLLLAMSARSFKPSLIARK